MEIISDIALLCANLLVILVTSIMFIMIVLAARILIEDYIEHKQQEKRNANKTDS